MTTTFRVAGAWPFPRDMLRYDEASGATEADKQMIDNLSAERCGDSAMVHVMHVVTLRAEGRFAPSRRRWESFGWRVLP